MHEKFENLLGVSVKMKMEFLQLRHCEANVSLSPLDKHITMLAHDWHFPAVTAAIQYILDVIGDEDFPVK